MEIKALTARVDYTVRFRTIVKRHCIEDVSVRAMKRRMEERIRKLCGEAVAERDPEKARELSRELRTELHNFIEALRARAPDYPGTGERRLHVAFPHTNTSGEALGPNYCAVSSRSRASL